MTHDDFKSLLQTRIEAIILVLDRKNKEYSRQGDKLHNFKRAAALQGVTPETALLGMLSKHLVSVMDMIHDLDSWEPSDDQNHLLPMWQEKIGDSINYLILLEGLVTERLQVPKKEEEVPF